MGRRLTLPLFIATLVSTWYGGILGVTEIAFNDGIYNFVTQGFFWYLSYLFIAFFLVTKIKRGNPITLPELIKNVAGEKSSKLASYLYLFNLIPIAYVMSIGFFIQSIFAIPFASSMILGVTLVLTYSYFTGFEGIVYSDVIQFFVMCSSVLMLLIYSVMHFGGLSYLQSSLPKSYFSPLGTQSLGEVLSWGLIAFGTLIDPNFYQRIFAAKNEKTAKNGIIISTCIWCVFDLSTTFGAMYAKAYMPQAQSSQAYLLYALEVLPSPLKGFFLAGMLATILSTLDSFLFLAGNTLSFDILGFKKNRLKAHKASILFIGLFSITLSFLFKGSIKNVWQALGSLSASTLLIPTLFSLKWPKRLSDSQFVLISLMGLVGVSLSHLYIPQIQIQPIYTGVLCSCCTLGFTLLKNQLK